MLHRLFRFPNQVDRVLALDMCRFVAAMLVLFFHIFEGLKHTYGEMPIGFEAIKAIANFFFLSFFWGSGYFIATTTLKEIDATGTVNPRRYAIKRVLRTWPVYFFLFSLFGLLNWQDSSFREAWPNFVTFTQNFIRPAIYAESWSIAIEEQFYVFFLVFALIVRPRWWLVVLVVLIALSIGARFILEMRWGPYLNNHTLIWSDALLIGCLWAWLVHRFPKILSIVDRFPNLISVISVAFYSLVLMNIRFFPFWNRTLLPIFGLIGLFPIISNRHFLSFIFNRKVAVPLSNLTYSLYLSQGLYIQFILLTYPFFADLGGPVIGVLSSLLIGLSVGLLISAAIFLMIEKPIYQWRNHLLKRE